LKEYFAAAGSKRLPRALQASIFDILKIARKGKWKHSFAGSTNWKQPLAGSTIFVFDVLPEGKMQLCVGPPFFVR